MAHTPSAFPEEMHNRWMTTHAAETKNTNGSVAMSPKML